MQRLTEATTTRDAGGRVKDPAFAFRVSLYALLFIGYRLHSPVWPLMVSGARLSVALTLLAGMMALTGYGLRVRISPTIVLVALWLTWALLTALWSHDPGLTVAGIGEGSVYFTIFLLITQFIQSGSQLRSALGAYLVGVDLMAALLAFELLTEPRALGRYSIPYINASRAALLMALGLPIALSFLLRGNRTSSRVGSALSLPMLVFGILLTGGRTGILVALISSGIFVLYYYGRRPRMVLSLLAGYVLMVSLLVPLVPQRAIERLRVGRGVVPLAVDSELRFDIWREGWRCLTPMSPIIGTGYRTFRALLADCLGLYPAHNLWLQSFVELGVVGLVVLVGVGLSLVVRFRFVLLRSDRALWSALGSAFLLASLVNEIDGLFAMWAFCGLYLTVSSARKDGTSPASQGVEAEKWRLASDRGPGGSNSAKS